MIWLPDEARCRPASPATYSYNCLAWALGTDLVSVWPPGDEPVTTAANFWPSDLPQDESITTIERLLSRLEFQQVDAPSKGLEVEAIALFTIGSAPSHFARRRPDGSWTSKLGGLADVDHDDPTDVECVAYGSLSRFYERTLPGPRLEDVVSDPRLSDAMERERIRRSLVRS